MDLFRRWLVLSLNQIISVKLYGSSYRMMGTYNSNGSIKIVANVTRQRRLSQQTIT